jgi:hypothetical protein
VLPGAVRRQSIALARAFRTVDPDVVNPAAEHWDRVTDLFRQMY